MTDRELLQQALEALMDAQLHNYALKHNETDDLITALRERLAQPYCDDCGGTDPECPLGTHWEGCEEVHPECRKPETVMAEYKFQTYAAYKTPDGEMKIGVVPTTRREWVGLTQEDWLALGCKTNEEIRVGLAIQAKLKEKNT